MRSTWPVRSQSDAGKPCLRLGTPIWPSLPERLAWQSFLAESGRLQSFTCGPGPAGAGLGRDGAGPFARSFQACADVVEGLPRLERNPIAQAQVHEVLLGEHQV